MNLYYEVALENPYKMQMVMIDYNYEDIEVHRFNLLIARDGTMRHSHTSLQLIVNQPAKFNPYEINKLDIHEDILQFIDKGKRPNLYKSAVDHNYGRVSINGFAVTAEYFEPGPSYMKGGSAFGINLTEVPVRDGIAELQKKSSISRLAVLPRYLENSEEITFKYFDNSSLHSPRNDGSVDHILTFISFPKFNPKGA